LNNDEVAVIGFFEKDDSSLFSTYQTVAKKLREKYRFGHSVAAEVLKKSGHK
jgi:protein disulfide isomerase family A protein 3